MIMQFIVSSKRTLSPFKTEVKTLGWTKLCKCGHGSIKTLCWCIHTHPPHKPNELEINILKPLCVCKCLVRWREPIPHTCNQMPDRTFKISSTGYGIKQILCIRNDPLDISYGRHIIKSVSGNQLNYFIEYCYFTGMQYYILKHLIKFNTHTVNAFDYLIIFLITKSLTGSQKIIQLFKGNQTCCS